jgi:hypothetical protein
MALAALLWDSAWNRFQWAMVALPVATVGAATAFGWWQNWPSEHLVWAPLAVALAIAAGEQLWRRGEIVRRAAWPQVLAFALSPLLALGIYESAAWAGAGAFALAALAWGIVSWRSHGDISALLANRTAGTERGERHLIGFGAYLLALVALAMTHYAAGVATEDAAWTYAAVGAAAILATALRDPRVREWYITLTLAGVLAGAIAFFSSVPHSGQVSLVLGLGAAVFLASGLANRSNARVITASILGFSAVAFAWDWADRELWSLALTYAIASGAIFALTAPARKNGTVMRSAVTFLSVAPIMLSLALAVYAVALRDMDEVPPDSLVRTAEWGSMVVVVLIAGLMLVGEGLYRELKLVALAGTAVMLLALELALAMLEIDNIQVHTAPAALYLIGLGLAIRRSDELFGENMDAHELVLVAGAALLVLPPAVQSFSPGAENWGMLVIGCGMGLLAAGFALFQRWLVVSGVVTLVGVAARFIFDRTTSGAIPYWVVLGVAGLALLGVGVLMLLERDWWDRTKARIAHWWLEAQFPGGGMAPHGR